MSELGGLPPGDGMLASFDHVVVLMLENRSFDNILGYLYPDGVPAGAPLGTSFEGIAAAERRAGKPLSNPFPKGAANPPPPGKDPIVVAPVDPGNYFTPYPDPGETYEHVNTQLFDVIDGGDQPPYNLPPGAPVPTMQGFVRDYVHNYATAEEPGTNPTYDEYRQIMQCYTPEQVPVITTLAEKFGVFDHWFCAVPSQTWCNRAFWNAGTSWGRVVNGPSVTWLEDSAGETVFNQIERSGEGSPLNWKVYSANPFVALTTLIHTVALAPYHVWPFDHFPGLEDFKQDCAAGSLPAYSFVEPRFIAPHNDMHPSSAHSLLYHKGAVGSVLLGELLIWEVYEAVRTSPAAERTLLVITFDEHGGCYDHVPPPGTVTAPDLTGYALEDGFDFTRLGLRVPTIMVSAHIAEHTVVNTPMHHGSFLKTVGQKWNAMVPGKFPPLTARVADAPEFTEVFTAVEPRPVEDWPVIPKPAIPADVALLDPADVPLSRFERHIVMAADNLPQVQAAKQTIPLPDPAGLQTVGEALDYLRAVPGLRPEEPVAAGQPASGGPEPAL